MVVKVFIPGALRGEADGSASVDVTVDGEANLESIMDDIAGRYPRLDRRIRDEQGRVRRYVNIFIGPDECRTLAGMASPVPDGVEVRILPSVAGG